MNDAVTRSTLVSNINSAFNAENIAISVGRLDGLSRRADFLAISRRVGILGTMTDAEFRRYRRRTNTVIPRPIQQVLTTVHHAALYATPPIPIHIAIHAATPPSIQVTYAEQLISIVLRRPDPV